MESEGFTQQWFTPWAFAPDFPGVPESFDSIMICTGRDLQCSLEKGEKVLILLVDSSIMSGEPQHASLDTDPLMEAEFYPMNLLSS